MMRRERGQSMVEMALSIPLLLIVLIGTLEVGWYYNVNINFADAAREGARWMADGDPLFNYRPAFNAHSPAYRGTPYNDKVDSAQADFYAQGAALILQNMQNEFAVQNSGWDDIVVSVYKTQNGIVTDTYPKDSVGGWSLTGKQKARITADYINRVTIKPDPREGCSTQGYVVVELFYIHKQLTGMLAIRWVGVPVYTAGYVYMVYPVNELVGWCRL